MILGWPKIMVMVIRDRGPVMAVDSCRFNFPNQRCWFTNPLVLALFRSHVGLKWYHKLLFISSEGAFSLERLIDPGSLYKTYILLLFIYYYLFLLLLLSFFIIIIIYIYIYIIFPSAHLFPGGTHTHTPNVCNFGVSNSCDSVTLFSFCKGRWLFQRQMFETRLWKTVITVGLPGPTALGGRCLGWLGWKWANTTCKVVKSFKAFQ